MKITLILIALTCTQAYNPKWLSNIYRDDSTTLPVDFSESYHTLGYQHFVYTSNDDAVKYMNIQCPNCETIFDLPKKKKINNKYKCSVCNHIWIEEKNKPDEINSAEKPNLKIN